MPNKLRPILLALILAGSSLGAAGCGDSGPDPSISTDDAATLAAKLQEIQANVDNGSCLVAVDRTDDLISEIDDLPTSVNDDVKSALENGANNLKLLLADPEQCAPRTTTAEPTTTAAAPTTTRERPTTTRERPTTTRTQPTQTQTTPSVTQTIPTGPGSPSGGVGPGGL